jgi:GNAT superfamily N-acetyltransferase
MDMVVIRPETPADAEAVAGVHVRGWQAGYAGIMPAEVLSRLNVAAWAQRRRDVGTAEPDHPFRTLLADHDGTVAGFVTFGPYRNDQDADDLDHTLGEILALYVEPARWGTGVGGALLAAAVAGLAGRGWTELRLWVLRDNLRARRFYQRAGLAADGGRSTYQVHLSRGRPPVGLDEIRYAAGLDRLRRPPDR